MVVQPDRTHVLSAAVGRLTVTKLCQATHLGATKTAESHRPRYSIRQLDNPVEDIIYRFATCIQVKPRGGRKVPESGLRKHHWEVNFTEIKPMGVGSLDFNSHLQEFSS